MDKQAIRDFDLQVEDGIGILVSAMLMIYDAAKCPHCKLLHDMELKPILAIASDFPGSEVERDYLFFMLGSICQHPHIWAMLGPVILTATGMSKEQQLHVVEMFVNELIFTSDSGGMPREKPNFHPQLN